MLTQSSGAVITSDCILKTS